MTILSKKFLIIGLLLTTMLSGCERTNQEMPQEPNPATAKAPAPAIVTATNSPSKAPETDSTPPILTSVPPLLTQPLQADFVEMPGDALPIWRQFRDQRPTLVIFSADPMLMVIDPQVDEQVATFVEHGKPDEFLRRGRTQVPDPLFLSRQTLTAALDGNFFSRIVWVMPPTKDAEVKPELLPRQLQQTGVMTTAEAAALTYIDGLFHGTLRGVPFIGTVASPLPKLDEPIILHFDFNFFSDQYRNEITTPLFTMLQGTLVALRQTGWHPLAVTFAISTEEGDFPLELRFIKDLLGEVFANPKQLDQGLSETWTLRKEAIYSESFFQTATILDHYLHMEELKPKDASVKYDIYRAMVMVKDPETALFYLDQAIDLDKGYAFEYIKLANTAKSKHRTAQALEYLSKAQKLMPQNPFVRMEAANLMIQLGMFMEADDLLQELQKLPWSTVYYPKIHSALNALKDELNNKRGKGKG